MSMEIVRANELFAGLLLVLVTIFLLKQLLPASSKSRTAPPSLPCPRGFPVIGNLHQLGALPHNNLAALATRLEAPLMMLRLGSVPTLVVSTADALRAVFQTSDRAMSGRPPLYAANRLTYGVHNISFAPPCGFWRAARRACMSELLGAPRVRGFRDVREGEAAALVAAITDLSRTGSPVNLSDKLLATSNMIVLRVAFGDDNGKQSIDAGAVLDERQYLLGAFFVADYIPWLGWVDTLRGLRRRLEQNFHELDAFYDRVIDDHIKKRKQGSEEQDLIDVLLRLHEDPFNGNTFSSRSQLKGILTDVFVAGTDTSSATVEWTMTELLRHPDVLAKAQREVRRVVAAGSDMVCEADLPRLKYLKQVIREAMRLHPPAPLLVPRETIESCTVYGYEIPAKTRVFVNAKAIGVDSVAWGADAATFLPERHEEIDDLSDHKPWHDSFALVPFGFGRRSCPGVHFATAVVELLLANLLFCFDWRAPPGGEVDVEEEIGLTVHRKNPLMLVAEKRSMN